MAVKKILVVSSLFPPDILGGAEQIAGNYARMCRDNGFEVGVLTTAKKPDEAANDQAFDGMRLWKVHMPRPYPILNFPQSKAWQKPLWHLQDHFDPRNEAVMDKVLDQFQPDVVAIHLLQGLGFNALKSIGRHNIPVVYILHDQGLVCIRANMFKAGHPCQGQCADCRLSSQFKTSMLAHIKSLAFCSPSKANLDAVSAYVPLAQYPNHVILNPERYPAPTQARASSDHLRLLFVGRLHKAKGVELLLEAVAALAASYPVRLTVIGSGQEDAHLKALYGERDWCDFTGFLSHAEISNHMNNSDLLCVPSIWPENSPGVIVHALSLGLPVMGSKKGGIPELINDGVAGELVEAGNLSAWTQALERLLQDKQRLEAWRSQVQTMSGRVSFESVERQHIDLIYSLLP